MTSAPATTCARAHPSWCTASLIAAVALTAACRTPYTPKPSRRIAMRNDNWGISYFKDGRRYSGGMFGHGVADVVAGYPPSVELAESGARRATIAFFGFVAGFACFSYAASEIDAAEDPSTELVALELGCVGVAVLNLWLMTDGYGRTHDAVNMYNDWIDTQPAPAAPATTYNPMRARTRNPSPRCRDASGIIEGVVQGDDGASDAPIHVEVCECVRGDGQRIEQTRMAEGFRLANVPAGNVCLTVITKSGRTRQRAHVTTGHTTRVELQLDDGAATWADPCCPEPAGLQWLRPNAN